MRSGKRVAAPAARNYARAWLDFIPRERKMDLLREVEQLVALWERCDVMNPFFSHPAVPRRIKLDMIDRLLGRVFSGEVILLLRLLACNRRLGLLIDIRDMVRAIDRRERGIRLVSVTSAAGLSAEEKTTLKRGLEDDLDGSCGIELEYARDPDLIGGLRILVGSMLLDLSLRGFLTRMEADLRNMRVDGMGGKDADERFEGG